MGVEAEGPPEDKPALAVPAGQIAEFCWEALAEQRREHGQQGGDAVLLASLHGAKGLEFPHVLIADGGWSASRDASAAEDERRVFYVGMTRARETLTLLEIAGGGHPHLPLLDAAAPSAKGAGDWLLRDAPDMDPPLAAVMARHDTRLTPADLDLGYAGRQPRHAPIHQQLAALQPASSLAWRAEPPASRRHLGSPASRRQHDATTPQFLLTTPDNHPIARLSKRAAQHWLPRIEQIEAIRVVALLRRDRAQTDPTYADSLRCDAWEVPLVEIQWREG